MIEFWATVDADSLPKTVQHLIPDVPLLFPASSFYRRGFKAPLLPAHIRRRAGDCGGFVATFAWGGEYRYSAAQLVDWYASFAPEWAAMMDYCCEDEITGGRPGIVRERQARTTELAWHFWQTYRAVSWAWVPTIQGWAADDYRCHAREMAPLIAEMRAHYSDDPCWRVGIGTLCRRASVAQIHAIVQAVAAELPDVCFHLWGVKLGALQSRIMLPAAVASVDSAAWDGMFGRDRDTWKSSGLRRTAWEYTGRYQSKRAHSRWPALIHAPPQLLWLNP